MLRSKHARTNTHMGTCASKALPQNASMHASMHHPPSPLSATLGSSHPGSALCGAPCCTHTEPTFSIVCRTWLILFWLCSMWCTLALMSLAPVCAGAPRAAGTQADMGMNVHEHARSLTWQGQWAREHGRTCKCCGVQAQGQGAGMLVC